MAKTSQRVLDLQRQLAEAHEQNDAVLKALTSERLARVSDLTFRKQIKLYKVLGPNGESVHGGLYNWSLPNATTGEPGAWQVVDGEPLLCARGFHLTQNPVDWWWRGDLRVFSAEVEWDEPYCISENFASPDSRDAKISAKRVRLIRELTVEECAELGVVARNADKSKTLYVNYPEVIAYGGSLVVTRSKASVSVRGSADVTTWCSTNVRIEDSCARVTVSGHSVVQASAGVVVAKESATVYAYDACDVFASDNAVVHVVSPHARVWVSCHAIALINKRYNAHNGCVVRSKKQPGVIYKRKNTQVCDDINGDRWKVTKSETGQLQFVQR